MNRRSMVLWLVLCGGCLLTPAAPPGSTTLAERLGSAGPGRITFPSSCPILSIDVKFIPCFQCVPWLVFFVTLVIFVDSVRLRCCDFQGLGMELAGKGDAYDERGI